MELWRYCKLVFKAGLEHWDKIEFVKTLIFLAILPLIAWLIGWRLDFSGNQIAFMIALACVVDVVIVIPTKIGMRYIRLITPKLQVDISEPEPQFIPGTDTVDKLWYHLQVYNPTNTPIKECFGKLLSFTANQVMAQGYPLPRPGLRFAWSTHGGATNCETRTLGSKSPDRLDILVFDMNSHIYIPELAQDGWTRSLVFSLPISPETYEMEVQVGSEAEAFEPTTRRLKIGSLVQQGKIIPQIELIDGIKTN